MYFIFVQQAALVLLEDRRIEVALKGVSKLGHALAAATDGLEDLAGQVSYSSAGDEILIFGRPISISRVNNKMVNVRSPPLQVSDR